MQKLTHILFDFFGTLVLYSESRIEQGYGHTHQLLIDNGSELAYSAFLHEWDRLFSEFEQRSAASRDEFSMTEICECFLQQTLAKRYKFELVASFRDTYLEEWSRGVSYILGVNEMLDVLAAKYTLVLVSNTHHADLVHYHLQNSGMQPYFGHVITSVEHGRRKPSGSVFEHALNVSNGQKASALYVGDSYVEDYQGAQAAGLACLLIDSDQRYYFPSSHRLKSILDVPLAIRKNQAIEI